MAREQKVPGTRATRNRRIKNWHVWLLIWVLVMAGAAVGSFWILGPGSKVSPADLDDIGVVATPRATPSPSASPTPSAIPSTEPTDTSAPSAAPTAASLDKSVRVAVFNNTGIRGHASRSADKAKSLGWNVVAVENWRGSVPSSTVFYSSGFEDEANALAKDLGISRVEPNHSGISLKGLSVVLRS